MPNYKYTGETPIVLAGLTLGDGVTVDRAPEPEREPEADGTSPVLHPGDVLHTPDDVDVNVFHLTDLDAPVKESKPRATRKPKEQ